jgi:hypothetical protein
MWVLCSRNYILFFLDTIDLILLFDFISIEHGIFCYIFLKFLINKKKWTFAMIFIFILLCEFSVVSKYKKMRCNFIFGFFTLYLEV